VEKCPQVLEEYGLTIESALEFADASDLIIQELHNWQVRLGIPHEEFEGRSVVRKEFFDDWWETRTRPQLAASDRYNGIRARAQEVCGV